jgi:hypothetical protein
VLAAGSVFLVFPAIGVASEEIGSLDGVSALRVVVVVFVSVLVFATIVVVPMETSSSPDCDADGNAEIDHAVPVRGERSRSAACACRCGATRNRAVPATLRSNIHCRLPVRGSPQRARSSVG